MIALIEQYVVVMHSLASEKRLREAEAKSIANRYVAEVAKLTKLFDNVDAEGRGTYLSDNQANENKRSEHTSEVRYSISGQKIKTIETITGQRAPNLKSTRAYIFDGELAITAARSADGTYKLQHGPAIPNPRTARLQKSNVYKFVHCPISLNVFYIPDLISSPDFKFKINAVDEITSAEHPATYKLHFGFEFVPAKLEWKGWMIVDPHR
jgi:hypothetical protein